MALVSLALVSMLADDGLSRLEGAVLLAGLGG
jgi:hypothetical protein